MKSDATLARLLRAPFLHFLLLGLALWLAALLHADYQFRVVQAPNDEVLQQLAHDWQASHGRKPDAAQLVAIKQAEIDERILFTEALRRHLHRSDPVVLRRLYDDARFLGITAPDEQLIRTALAMRLYEGDEVIRRRLVQRMQALGRVGARPPTETDLKALYDSEPERWQQPARISFVQVFVAASAAAGTQAKALLSELQARTVDPTSASAPFLAGQQFELRSPAQVARIFGSSFAEAAFTQPQSEAWIGPLASSYGWHLLRIDAYQAPSPRPFASVETQLRSDWTSRREREQLQAFVAHLRGRYRVVAP